MIEYIPALTLLNDLLVVIKTVFLQDAPSTSILSSDDDEDCNMYKWGKPKLISLIYTLKEENKKLRNERKLLDLAETTRNR